MNGQGVNAFKRGKAQDRSLQSVNCISAFMTL